MTFLFAFLLLVGYLLLGMGLAGLFLWGWVIFCARRDGRRKARRAGELPQEVYLEIVETPYVEWQREIARRGFQ